MELLIDARVILPCTHSDGDNIPLAGQSDPRIFKTYYLDVGLLNALLKLDLEAIDREFKNNFGTRGVLAEQYVAQHLAFFQGHTQEPSLHYHLRDRGSQKAEVDFLIEEGGHIYPIE